DVWPEVMSVARSLIPPRLDSKEFMHCLLVRGAAWFASRRGAQGAWKYDQTGLFAELLRRLLMARMLEAQLEPTLREFRDLARQLCGRSVDLFPDCGTICPQMPSICLYRHAAADLILSRVVEPVWIHAVNGEKDSRRSRTWGVCQDAGAHLINFPGEASGW